MISYAIISYVGKILSYPPSPLILSCYEFVIQTVCQGLCDSLITILCHVCVEEGQYSTYLFICGLFNNVVSISDYMVKNYKIINKQ
jgi:hypothetical protein